MYGLLESGPVALVTTARAGRANIMPMSWHTMMDFVLPLVGCVISNQRSIQRQCLQDREPSNTVQRSPEPSLLGVFELRRRIIFDLHSMTGCASWGRNACRTASWTSLNRSDLPTKR